MQDFVGETLDLPLDQRLEASLAAVVFAVAAGPTSPAFRTSRRASVWSGLTEAILGCRPRW
jgi:hypothetical protein